MFISAVAIANGVASVYSNNVPLYSNTYIFVPSLEYVHDLGLAHCNPTYVLAPVQYEVEMSQGTEHTNSYTRSVLIPVMINFLPSGEKDIPVGVISRCVIFIYFLVPAVVISYGVDIVNCSIWSCASFIRYICSPFAEISMKDVSSFAMRL